MTIDEAIRVVRHSYQTAEVRMVCDALEAAQARIVELEGIHAKPTSCTCNRTDGKCQCGYY